MSNSYYATVDAYEPCLISGETDKLVLKRKA